MDSSFSLRTRLFTGLTAHSLAARIFFQKRLYLLLTLVLSCFFSLAQTISPFIVNAAGKSAVFSNYRFEWSVGESMAINTMYNNDMIVTNGLLQDYIENQEIINVITSWNRPVDIIPSLNQSSINIISSWLPDEVKIFPNPVISVLEVSIINKRIGPNQLQLFDMNGKKIMEKKFESNGFGSFEKLDLSGLPPGLYVLSIQEISLVTGKVLKSGAFKIIKV